MSPLRWFAIVTFLVSACSTTPALGLAGEHPATQPIGVLKADWPAAPPTAINSPGRVAGHWVNANDEFFYRGDTAALNAFVHRLAETKLPLTLVLHTASPHRSLFWGDEPRIPYDWTLLVGTSGWVSPAWQLNFDNPDTRYALRVDVWLDGGLLQDEIELPAGTRLHVEREALSTTQPATSKPAR